MRRRSLALLSLVLVGLAGCGSAAQPTSVAVPIPLYDTTTHGKLAKLPAALGLLLPRVSGYSCGGYITLAQAKKYKPGTLVTAPAFWQLQLICVDPRLKFHLPKGRIRAGAVWIDEQPGDRAMTLMQEMQFGGAGDLKTTTVHRLEVGEGSIDFGGYTSQFLWLRKGSTTYIGWGRKYTRPVLIHLYGRTVPMQVLLRFAESLQPISATAR